MSMSCKLGREFFNFYIRQIRRNPMDGFRDKNAKGN